MKRTLTEAQLKNIIAKTVKNALKENIYIDSPHADPMKNPRLFGDGNHSIEGVDPSIHADYYAEWKEYYDNALRALNEFETQVESEGSRMNDILKIVNEITDKFYYEIGDALQLNDD